MRNDIFLEKSYRLGYRWVIQYVDKGNVWCIRVEKTQEKAQAVLDKAIADGRKVGSKTPTPIAAPERRNAQELS